MAVVPLPRNRRRLSIRYYLCTEATPVRIPLSLYRDLVAGTIPAGKFSDTIQKIAEVLITVGQDGARRVKIRRTAVQFDHAGLLNLAEAAEAAALALEGSEPKNIGENIVDIGATLRSRQAESKTNWRISDAMARAIRDDIEGKVRLPVLRLTKN